MKLDFNFAWRYLWGKKSTNAINLISIISVLGMMVGAMALILVLSVFNGFEDLVISLYNSFNPDLKITATKGKVFEIDPNTTYLIQNIEGVESVSEVVEEMALIKYEETTLPCKFKGVDDSFAKVTGIDSTLIDGHFRLQGENGNNAVLGLGVANVLGINLANPFAQLQIFMPKRGAKVSSNPDNAFNLQSIQPGGVFSIQEEFDKQYVFVPIKLLRKLLNYDNQVSSLELKLSKNHDDKFIKKELAKILGIGFKIQNRYEQDEFLYKVMQTEKWAVFCILCFIMVIASFNMIGSLSMLVIEKAKDIQTLKALGANRPLLRNIFLIQGLLMAVGGGLFGMFIAFIICVLQQEFGLIKLAGNSFLVQAYPVSMRLMDFVLVFLAILTIAFLASWYPAMRGSRRDSFEYS